MLKEKPDEDEKICCLLLTAVMLVSCLAGCSGQMTEGKKGFQTFEDFENAKLGVLAGSEFDRHKNCFPIS